MPAGRLPLFILLGVVIVDVIGVGLMLPVLPELVRELTGGDFGTASAQYGLIVALYSLAQFVCGPILGAVSDRFGRRPVILVAMAGLAVDYLVLALAPSIGWIVAARIAGGILGSSITSASAYVADITTPEKRAANFGMLGAAIGIGFILGPVLGGLLGEIGPRVPFWVAAGLCAANFAFAWFRLPESLPEANRRPFSVRRANPVGAYGSVLVYPAVLAIAAVFAFANLAQRALESTWVLFTGYRFGWGTWEVGLSLAFVGVLTAIASAGLTRVVVPRLGEYRTLSMGLAIGAVSILAMAFVTEGWMIYVAVAVYVLGWGVVGPSAQALLTRSVPPDRQGVLQGVLTSMLTATGIVAPPVAAGLLGFFVGPSAPFHFPGVAFFIGALLFAGGFALTRTSWFRARLPKGTDLPAGEGEALASGPHLRHPSR